MGAGQLDGLRRLILRRRVLATKFLIMAAMLAFATGARWLLDHGANGVPFLTFYPVVLLTALLLGWRFGLLSAVCALVLVRFLFAPGWQVVALPTRMGMFLLYSLTIAIILLTGHFVRRLLLESERLIAESKAFNDELQHRSRNMLQVLRALMGRSPPPGEDAADFHRKLAGRVEALSRANQLLGFGALGSAELGELVAAAVAPFDPDRFHCDGPDCRLQKATVVPLVMTLHELATNAVKYGALSVDQGEVAISWRLDGPDKARLEWIERGGPPVRQPARRGMGSRLLRPHGGLSAIELDWNPAGLACRLELVVQAEGAGSGY